MKPFIPVFLSALLLFGGSGQATDTVKLHFRFTGNPDPVVNGIHVVDGVNTLSAPTLGSQITVFDASGAPITNGRWKSTTGISESIDGATGVILSTVTQGQDEGVMTVPMGQDITIDAVLSAYTLGPTLAYPDAMPKHIVFNGKTDLGKFAEYYFITAPGDTGGPANVGFSMWLTKN